MAVHPVALALAMAVTLVVGLEVDPTAVASPASIPANLEVVKVLGDLNFPVAMAVAPDRRIFFNELRTGRTRVIQDGALLPDAFSELPVSIEGEQGLLGLALHPDFPRDPWIYLYHTYRDEGGAVHNRLVAVRADGNRGVELRVILEPLPASTNHDAGILAFGPDGKLYASVGDAGQPAQAQDPTALNGKILRLNPDGSIPADNPVPGSPVYALGLRNPFGMAFAPDGRLYATENGPSLDEVNIITPGGNYGWPNVTGNSSMPQFLNPILTYSPSIAPTGIAFYTGGLLREDLRGAAFFGSWVGRQIRRIVANPATGAFGDSVDFTAPEGILDVDMTIDGNLYFTTPTAIFRVVGPRGDVGGGPLGPPAVSAPLALASVAGGILLGAWGYRRFKRRAK